MSLLTLIDGIPLYSTQEEALQWGASLNISGFHTHTFNGQIGYMPGYSHEDINLSLDLLNISFEDEENSIDPAAIPTAQLPQIQIETPIDIEEPAEQTQVAQDIVNVPQSTPTQTTTTPTPSPSPSGGGGGY